ncbi:hypothetical protein BTR14_02615 [Rhizobium rhizosphaerae]|nr:GGDEF domain-containing protein [Xaviernesmea rhizosphaerae]OQP88348.1 hypothetical protein BTR14_02615 [Xaviernesmea rhizosphaerae]
MPQAVGSRITIKAVERAMARRSWRLRFSAALEEAFLESYVGQRLAHALVWCLTAMVIYDLMLVKDALLMPEHFPAMFVMRCIVFTAACLWLTYVKLRWRQPDLHDLLSVAIFLLAVLLPLLVMVWSDSPYRVVYQVGTVAMMIYFTLVVRLRFVPTLCALMIATAIQISATLVSGMLTMAAFVSFTTIVLCLAASAYILERAERRDFLRFWQERLLQQSLREEAERDGLTGLRNRYGLAADVIGLWQTAIPQCIFALMIDIDHFKAFNIAEGSARADRCMQRIAARLCEFANQRVRIYRNGGDRILVLALDMTIDEVFGLAEQLRAAVEGLAIPHQALGRGQVVTVSLGVAAADAPHTSIDTLLDHAAFVLHEAKRHGRNCVWPPQLPSLLAARAAAPVSLTSSGMEECGVVEGRLALRA